MGYKGGRLTPWFNDGPAKAVAHQMAEKGAKALHRKVVKHTPKDTGHLSTSWKRKPVIVGLTVTGHTMYASGVETFVDYAPYVEHGTGLWGPKHAKYPIRPKLPGGVLHFFTKEGAEVFTKLVMHPGSPGAHMVAISVAELEVELPALLQSDLEMWARLTANQNKTGLVT